MRIFRAFGTLVVICLVLSGCGPKKLERFSTTMIHDFEVDLIAGTSTIDLTGDITSMINRDLERADDIKGYERLSMDYRIFEFDGDTPNTFTGELGFSNANANSPGITIPLIGIDLPTESANSNRLILNLSNQDIATIHQYFLDTNGLRLFLNGHPDSTPLHFRLQVTVNVDAIADVSFYIK